MKKKWLFGVITVLLLSCSGLTLPEITTTLEPAFPTPSMTTTIVSPPTLSAAAELTPTPQVGADERPFGVVIARMIPGPFYLLGGAKDGEWLSPEVILPDLFDEETYQTFRMEGPSGSAKGKQPVFEPLCKAYQVETDSYPLSGPAVGVTGSWDVTPRLVQEIPADTPTYVDELTNWLVGKGFPEPVVEISQILRVDLEGDGTEEVLISASHFVEPTGHSVSFGDYSLIIMRKVVGDTVETIPILADYYYQDNEIQFPLTYALTFPADLDDDGVLEVLVGVERWEGSGMIIFEIEGTTARPIFEALCGL